MSERIDTIEKRLNAIEWTGASQEDQDAFFDHAVEDMRYLLDEDKRLIAEVKKLVSEVKKLVDEKTSEQKVKFLQNRMTKKYHIFKSDRGNGRSEMLCGRIYHISTLIDSPGEMESLKEVCHNCKKEAESPIPSENERKTSQILRDQRTWRRRWYTVYGKPIKEPEIY